MGQRSLLSDIPALLFCISLLVLEPSFAQDPHDEILNSLLRIENRLDELTGIPTEIPELEVDDKEQNIVLDDASFAEETNHAPWPQRPPSEESATDGPWDDSVLTDVEKLIDPRVKKTIAENIRGEEMSSPDVMTDQEESYAPVDALSWEQPPKRGRPRPGVVPPRTQKYSRRSFGSDGSTTKSANGLAVPRSEDGRRKNLAERIIDLEHQLMRTAYKISQDDAGKNRGSSRHRHGYVHRPTNTNKNHNHNWLDVWRRQDRE